LPHRALVITDIVKVLGDPVRWDILRQVAAQGELPCSVLVVRAPQRPATTRPVPERTAVGAENSPASSGSAHMVMQGGSR
jgi:hypothetical protein